MTDCTTPTTNGEEADPSQNESEYRRKRDLEEFVSMIAQYSVNNLQFLQPGCLDFSVVHPSILCSFSILQ